MSIGRSIQIDSESIPELEKVKTGWPKVEMVIDTDIPSYTDIGPTTFSFPMISHLIMIKGNLTAYVTL